MRDCSWMKFSYRDLQGFRMVLSSICFVKCDDLLCPYCMGLRFNRYQQIAFDSSVEVSLCHRSMWSRQLPWHAWQYLFMKFGNRSYRKHWTHPSARALFVSSYDVGMVHFSFENCCTVFLKSVLWIVDVTSRIAGQGRIPFYIHTGMRFIKNSSLYVSNGSLVSFISLWSASC